MPSSESPRPASITACLLALLVLFCASVLIPGCAKRPGPEREVPETPAEWQLSQRAEAAYLYLVFEEARRGQDHQDAEEALSRLLEIDPAPRIHLEGANYYWTRGEMHEARTLLKQGLERHPGNRDLSLTLATTYLAENRYDDAALTLKDYLTANPDDLRVRKELAAILIEAEQYTQALDSLDEIPQPERSAMYHYYRAKALSGLGLNNRAIESLRQALEKKPEFVEAWAELAFLYEKEKDYLAAEAIYSRILDLGETGREVWLRLIDLNIKLNNPDKAMAYYRQGPDDVDFALEASTAFLDADFHQHAKEILLPLLEQEDVPDKIFFYLALSAFEGDENPQKALQYLERIPGTDPTHPDALRFRIRLLMELDREREALELIQEGKKNYSDVPIFYILHAEMLQDRGEQGKALDVMDEARAKWPDNEQVLYSTGMLLDGMGRSDEAIRVMEQILAKDPEHADALNFVGYVLADRNRDLERALVMIRKALELKPDSGYIIDSLAWVYYRLGRLQEAWEEINKAAGMVEGDPVVWEHYGDIAKALGKIGEAAKGYRKSLEIDPDNESVIRKLEEL